MKIIKLISGLLPICLIKKNYNLLKKLKKKNSQIDKYYAINWSKISRLTKKYLVPNLGYNKMFVNIEKEMKSLGIKVYKKSVLEGGFIKNYYYSIIIKKLKMIIFSGQEILLILFRNLMVSN